MQLHGAVPARANSFWIFTAAPPFYSTAAVVRIAPLRAQTRQVTSAASYPDAQASRFCQELAEVASGLPLNYLHEKPAGTNAVPTATSVEYVQSEPDQERLRGFPAVSEVVWDTGEEAGG